MPKEPNTAELKLIQYLNQAYGKERQLETALQAHIGITTGVKGRDAYAKRLKEHLKETTAQAKNLERRIKKIGGKAALSPVPEAAATVADTAVAAAGKLKEAVRGPLHTLRGTSPEELLVKNAQTELSEEFHEIAIYTTIETMAEAVGDKETAKLARDHKRQEQRMATFLERQLPVLTKAVATTEIPASERKTPRRPASRSRARSSSNGSSRPSGSRSRARSGSRS